MCVGIYLQETMVLASNNAAELLTLINVKASKEQTIPDVGIRACISLRLCLFAFGGK